ncbi:hypothetical protein, partial [Pseudomonas aeruginosa]|uniref:hypothetical protein n=1 Tax=Pseudomonas aeruginosa TaxID=287 RepID=UPI0021CACBD9
EGVGATAAALVDLSTVAGNKISNPPWVKFQSAGWVNFPSAPTHAQSGQVVMAGLPRYGRAITYLEAHPAHFAGLASRCPGPCLF